MSASTSTTANASLTSSRRASATYNSVSTHVGIGLERSFMLSDASSLTPGIRADHTLIRDASYSETGAGVLNLDVASRSADQFVLSTEAKLKQLINDNLSLGLSAGVGYDAINKPASIVSAYGGAPSAMFVTYGLKQSPWLGHAGASLTHVTRNGVEIIVRYELDARASFTNQTASAKAQWTF